MVLVTRFYKSTIDFASYVVRGSTESRCVTNKSPLSFHPAAGSPFGHRLVEERTKTSQCSSSVDHMRQVVLDQRPCTMQVLFPSVNRHDECNSSAPWCILFKEWVSCPSTDHNPPSSSPQTPLALLVSIQLQILEGNLRVIAVHRNAVPLNILYLKFGVDSRVHVFGAG